MIAQDTRKDWDVVIVGSGPGGGSVAHALASTGKRILILERGGYLPRSSANWSSETVFVDGKYQVDETWYDHDRQGVRAGAAPATSAAIPRSMARPSSGLRGRDFEAVAHRTGIFPCLAGALRRLRALVR